MSDPNTLEIAPSNVEQARAWDGAEGDYWAEHADRFDRSMAGYQPAFLDAARIGRADRVLDVGCGTGQTTRDAARRAGDGYALGVDLSASMIDVARRRAAERRAGQRPVRAGRRAAAPVRPGRLRRGAQPDRGDVLRRSGRPRSATWPGPCAPAAG